MTAVLSGPTDCFAHPRFNLTPTPEPPGSSLGYLVWEDLDGNGIREAGEPGMPGVVMRLARPNGLVVTTATDSNGFYSFTGISAGTYAVTVDNSTLPSGNYSLTTNNNPLTVDGSPYAAEFNPVTNKLYVAVGPHGSHHNPQVLKVYNSTGSGLFFHKSLPISDMAEGGLAINSVKNQILIPHSTSVNRVTVVDGSSDTVIGVLAPPAYSLDNPYGVEVNPNTGRVYIGNRSFNDVNGSILVIQPPF